MKFLILFFIPYFLYATSLHDAIKHRDLKAFNKAISSGININALQAGETALSLAILGQNREMVKKLLEASAKTYIGHPTAIHLALQSDNIEIIKLVLKSGARLPKGLGVSGKGLIYDLLLKRYYKSTDFVIRQGLKFKKRGSLHPFSLALSYAPLFLVKTFIEHGSSLNYKDPLLDRPLDIALRLERHDVVALLLDKKVSIKSRHFLETAVSHKDIQSLKLLFASGCKIDRKTKKLLLVAAKLGDLEVLKELLKAGASLDYQTSRGETALSYALRFKHKNIVQWLLDQDLKVNRHGKAIFYAIDRGDKDLVQLLVSKGIGLKRAFKNGLTPLLYANKAKQFELANYFISLDLDLEAKDRQGETALFQSIRYFQNDMQDLLLSKGVNADIKNKAGLTLLELCIETANFTTFKKLLALGVKVKKKALIRSVKRGLERFYVLLNERFDTKSIRDTKANTLLHIAARFDRMQIIKRLVLEGFDLEAINHRGETALHVAAKEGFQRSSSILLSFDADIKAIDMRDYQAKNLALKYNHVKLSKWLDNYQIKLEERMPKADDNATKEDDNATTVSEI